MKRGARTSDHSSHPPIFAAPRGAAFYFQNLMRAPSSEPTVASVFAPRPTIDADGARVVFFRTCRHAPLFIGRPAFQGHFDVALVFESGPRSGSAVRVPLDEGEGVQECRQPAFSISRRRPDAIEWCWPFEASSKLSQSIPLTYRCGARRLCETGHSRCIKRPYRKTSMENCATYA